MRATLCCPGSQARCPQPKPRYSSHPGHPARSHYPPAHLCPSGPDRPARPRAHYWFQLSSPSSLRVWPLELVSHTSSRSPTHPHSGIVGAYQIRTTPRQSRVVLTPRGDTGRPTHLPARRPTHTYISLLRSHEDVAAASRFLEGYGERRSPVPVHDTAAISHPHTWRTFQPPEPSDPEKRTTDAHSGDTMK